MITAIEIENFKGFGVRQRIEFAPVTLLFGRNSAGKSSIFHSLFFLEELFRTRSPNFETLEFFSDPTAPIDLGGFKNAVFRQETHRTIQFLIELNADSFDARENPRFEFLETSFWDMGGHGWKCEVGIGLVEQSSQWVHLAVLNQGSQLASIDWNHDTRKYELSVNLDSCFETQMDFPYEPSSGIPTKIFEFADFGSSLAVDESLTYLSDEDTEVLAYVRAMLDGVFGFCKKCLHDTIYIGPLRAIINEWREEYCWANGLDAWEELSDASVLNSTNKMLERLGLGYQIEVEYRPGCRVEPLLVPRTAGVDASHRLRVRDVGCGISQIVPIIVALEVPRRKMVMVEQPELHLHPSMQTELGDLFLFVATSDSDSCAVVETHSEHLILRILRRIRETAQSELATGAPSVWPGQVAVYFIDQSVDGSRAKRLRISDEGEFIDSWPYGFFDERIGEMYS